MSTLSTLDTGNVNL